METKFSERLNELMEDKNLSSLALSKILGVNDTTILRWRKGLINPTIDKLSVLCDYFGVTADYLLGRED